MLLFFCVGIGDFKSIYVYMMGPKAISRLEFAVAVLAYYQKLNSLHGKPPQTILNPFILPPQDPQKSAGTSHPSATQGTWWHMMRSDGSSPWRFRRIGSALYANSSLHGAGL
jgi:hypothetical protein